MWSVSEKHGKRTESDALHVDQEKQRARGVNETTVYDRGNTCNAGSGAQNRGA